LANPTEPRSGPCQKAANAGSTAKHGSDNAIAVTISAGSHLGDYELLELIGRGAMGAVYRAYHAALDRVVAIKVLDSLASDLHGAERFQREARAIAHLRHPNILAVFDFGEASGVPYMVVEYMPGGSLAAVLATGPAPSMAVKITLLRGVAAGLDYAHAAGVVHRDVKPANVLLSAEGIPVLGDFGLARLRVDTSLTGTGLVLGSPAYMAPEQAKGLEVGPAADRYSFAVMAYQVLTGELPFNAAQPLEVLYMHVNSQPLLPSAVRPGLPRALDAVLLRGLAKESSERWGSCTALVDRIAQSLGSSSPVDVALTLVLPRPLASGGPEAMPVTERVEAVAGNGASSPTGESRAAAISGAMPSVRNLRLMEWMIVASIAALVAVLSLLLNHPPTATGGT
jgi:serine/threonine protein kinase